MMGTPFTFADLALAYRSALRKASRVAIVFARRVILSFVTAIAERQGKAVSDRPTGSHRALPCQHQNPLANVLREPHAGIIKPINKY